MTCCPEGTGNVKKLGNLTSISSLYLSRGASIMLRSLKASDSTSKVWPVSSVIRFQWRVIMARSAISSRSGQHSLNSSMVLFRSRKACHSFRARGSLRHLYTNDRFIGYVCEIVRQAYYLYIPSICCFVFFHSVTYYWKVQGK